MAQVHAFASSRPTFTVPAIKRVSVWQTRQVDDRSGSPAKGIVIAAVLGALMWYGIALLAL